MTNTSEVFDVTGAGDTVIAIVTLAVAAGADLFDAARLRTTARVWSCASGAMRC